MAITTESVFNLASGLVSDDDTESPEYNRGVTELACLLTDLSVDDRYTVLAYLRSIRRFNAERGAFTRDKSRIESLLTERSSNV